VRTRATLGGVFASLAVLTIGWQAGAASIATPDTTSAGGTASSGSSTGTGTGTGGGTTTPSDGASSGGTYTGTSVSTRYGSVQVQVVVSGGTITDVTTLRLTDHDGRSVQISNRAAPILRSEVLQSQSAEVQTVGGATYTSDAYLTSLQSALDQAGL
jgi:uncharacterized protein with FMN-binding domain